MSKNKLSGVSRDGRPLAAQQEPTERLMDKLTEYADELLADGGEEALMELMDVNDVLREVDESLVREIVDEEALRAAAKRVVDHVASGTERAAAKSDVDERDPGETKTALGAIKDQAKTLMSRILQK